MTGYGTAAGKVGKGRLYLEIKTINHRYCELACKMPPRMGGLENGLREYLQTRLQRGRIEIFLKELEPVFGKTTLALNIDLARSYQKAFQRLQKALHLKGKADFLSLTRLEPFVQAQEPTGNYLGYLPAIQRLAQQALTQVERMRKKEGDYLLRDQKKRLKSLQRFLNRIQARGKVNSQKRLHAENSNGIEKTDTTEELIRLQSHVRQYAQLLASRAPVGRKLDFLIQEMHREINTIGAKAADAQISRDIVESKSLLENLREQVQNIL